jgi:hypothetical protein
MRSFIIAKKGDARLRGHDMFVLTMVKIEILQIAVFADVGNE